jgi:DNA repair exonuclease SbcCD ATPase subunit
MAYKLVYNIEPASPSMISSLDRHCLVREPDGSSNIVTERSHLNRILEGHEDGLTASLKALYASGVKKPTAQAEKPYLRIVLSASPEYFRPGDPGAVGTWEEDRLAAWEEATMNQLRAEHGDDLIFAELHLDEDTPHIHAVVAPTYLRKARVPGKQKRGETPEQFEERKAAARASEGIRTVGRASHPTLSKQGSFQRLRERMTVAVDHLGIEYGEDRAIDAPDGQSTREWVIQEAARLRAEQAELEQDRKALAQEREESLNEALERQRMIERTGKLATEARDRIAQTSREQEERSRERVAELEAQANAAERRLERLREALSASQEAEERVQALAAREKALLGSLKLSEARLATLHTDKGEVMDRIGELRGTIADLEAQETELRNAVQLSGDGAANFEIAMNEVARVTESASDMSLTNELLADAQSRAFKDDQGQDRRFAQDDAQNNLVVRVITFGFQKAVDLFERIRSLVRFNDEIERARTFPEPLMQMQNILDATNQAVRETLTQLGVADQRPDVGEKDENGDPPPVLELVFTRANRKAKQLNNELAARLGPSGPPMR